MKNDILKSFIAIGLIILAILSIIFGAYLPWVKSRNYIKALLSVSSVKTVEEFEANFDKPFKFYSPIGDEEVAKFLANDILQIIMQQNQSEAVDRKLVVYIEPYLFKNDVRHLSATGQMYQVLWQKYGKEEDFQKTENYYKMAYAIGPKLPPVLYAMLNLYQIKGDKQKVKEIGEIILGYWPENDNIKNLIKSL